MGTRARKKLVQCKRKATILSEEFPSKIIRVREPAQGRRIFFEMSMNPLEFKFCCFTFALYTWRYINLCSSPISKRRISAAIKANDSVAHSGHKDLKRLKHGPRFGRLRSNSSSKYETHLPQNQEGPSPLHFCRLLAFIKAFKNHHTLSYYGMFAFCIHLLLLFHFVAKSLLFIYLSQSIDGLYQVPKETIDYMHSIYYPHLLSHPDQYALTFLATGLSYFAFCIRLQFLHTLISETSRDQHSSYKQIIKPSQVTLAYLSLFKMSIKDYFRLARDSLQHRRSLRDNRDSLLRHCSLSTSAPLDKFELRSSCEQVYSRNLIDFDKCMQKYSHCFTAKLGDNIKSQSEWHLPEPVHRCDLTEMNYLMAVVVTGCLIAVSFYFIAVVVVTYIELATAQATNQGLKHHWEIDWLDVEFVRNQWLTPQNFFKMFEAYVFLALLVPPLFDVALFYFTIVHLYSRVLKMRDVLELELTFIRHHSAGPVTFQISGDSNKRLIYYSRLVALLIIELHDVKNEWNTYLKLILSECILSFSFSSAMATRKDSLWDFMIVVLGLLISSIPLLLCLLSGAVIEQGLRQVYRVIARLLVNESGILWKETLLFMLQINERLNFADDRSLLTVGEFALTTSSVGPIVATIASGSLLLNRFIPQMF